MNDYECSDGVIRNPPRIAEGFDPCRDVYREIPEKVYRICQDCGLSTCHKPTMLWTMSGDLSEIVLCIECLIKRK